MTLSIYFAIFAAASDGKWKNVKSLLDISKFLGNPNFDFVKKYIVWNDEYRKNEDSIDILCEWKSYKFFCTRIKYVSVLQTY